MYPTAILFFGVKIPREIIEKIEKKDDEILDKLYCNDNGLDGLSLYFQEWNNNAEYLYITETKREAYNHDFELINPEELRIDNERWSNWLSKINTFLSEWEIEPQTQIGWILLSDYY